MVKPQIPKHTDPKGVTCFLGSKRQPLITWGWLMHSLAFMYVMLVFSHSHFAISPPRRKMSSLTLKLNRHPCRIGVIRGRLKAVKAHVETCVP